jgi:hypothetical protein
MARQQARGILDRAVEKLGNIAYESAVSGREESGPAAVEPQIAEILSEVRSTGAISGSQTKQDEITKAIESRLIDHVGGDRYQLTMLGQYLSPPTSSDNADSPLQTAAVRPA